MAARAASAVRPRPSAMSRSSAAPVLGGGPSSATGRLRSVTRRRSPLLHATEVPAEVLAKLGDSHGSAHVHECSIPTPPLSCPHGAPQPTARTSARSGRRRHPRSGRPTTCGRAHLRDGIRGLCRRPDRPRDDRLRGARLPPSAIADHVNEVDVGTLDGVVVAAVKAKSLPCDGATWQEAGLPARTLASLGCRSLLYSANSGSMTEEAPPGSFLAFTDHINFSGINPLSTEREGGPWGTPYLSMAELYDAELTDRVRDAAGAAGVTMPIGVAGYWMGPSFETPAEIRLARMAGCAISSNSFLPEVMAAYHAGLRVVAFTFVSTWSAGIGEPIVLGPVVDLAHRHHDDFRTIVRAGRAGAGDRRTSIGGPDVIDAPTRCVPREPWPSRRAADRWTRTTSIASIRGDGDARAEPAIRCPRNRPERAKGLRLEAGLTVPGRCPGAWVP